MPALDPHPLSVLQCPSIRRSLMLSLLLVRPVNPAVTVAQRGNGKWPRTCLDVSIAVTWLAVHFAVMASLLTQQYSSTTLLCSGWTQWAETQGIRSNVTFFPIASSFAKELGQKKQMKIFSTIQKCTHYHSSLFSKAQWLICGLKGTFWERDLCEKKPSFSFHRPVFLDTQSPYFKSLAFCLCPQALILHTENRAIL